MPVTSTRAACISSSQLGRVASGYSLDWHATDDYTVEQRTRITGDFPTAISEALHTAAAAGGARYLVKVDDDTHIATVTEDARHQRTPPGRCIRVVSRTSSRLGEASELPVIWKSPVDFVIETDTKLNGSFPDAVQQVVDGLHGAGSPITSTIYEGNRTVVISEVQ